MAKDITEQARIAADKAAAAREARRKLDTQDELKRKLRDHG